MSRYSQNSQRHSETTDLDLMLPSVHSLQPSRATRPKQEQLLGEKERSNRYSAPPTLLYRFQMSNNQMRSLSPRRSRSMSQPLLGSRIGKGSVLCYDSI